MDRTAEKGRHAAQYTSQLIQADRQHSGPVSFFKVGRQAAQYTGQLIQANSQHGTEVSLQYTGI